MKLNKFPQVFSQAMPVLKMLENAGFEAYFVGGSVRDILLHRHIHDVDIASSAYPEEVKEIFEKTIDTGIQHGTVTVLYNGNSYEITTFRTESGYQDYRRPDHVTFVQNLDEDLKRRDFTINALAMNTKGEIIDLFNGLQDLDNRIIRAVGDPERRFHEDALRMMRAVRFMSQLNFSLDQNTKRAISDHHQLLQKISVERIRDEFVKMGLGQNSREAFNVFLETNLSQDVPHFKDKQDMLTVFTKLRFSPTEETSLWAIIIILIKIPNSKIHQFMRDWKNSNAMTNEVERVVALFDVFSNHAPSDFELYKAGKQTLLNTIEVAHILGQPINSEALVDRYLALPIKEDSQLAIDGKYLIEFGIKPGPKLGNLLNEIKENVISGKIANTENAINEFLKNKENNA